MRTSLHVPENLLQLYVENSPLALIQFGSDLRITAWSERATAMFGWTEDEVRGKTLDEFGFVYEDDRAGVAALFVELANGPVNWKAHTNRNLRKDGELVWCRWFNAYLVSERFTGFVSLAEDITETTLAREAASASEERLRALFEATPDALTFFDARGRITDSNPAAERLMGVPRTELNAHPFTDFILPEDLTFAGELFARALTETVSAELTVKRLDGTTFPVELVAGPLREGGAVTGVYCSARDITERNEALAQVEASEERFRSIFDNNPDPMVAFDASGTVTRANGAAGRVLEIDPESLVGKTLGDIATDGDLTAALACFNRALAGMAGGVELHVRHAREHSLPAFVTMIPIRFRGRAAGVDLHVRDLRAAIAQQRQIAAHGERIRDLYMSAAAASENAEQQIKATIESGCRILGVSAGALYETAGDTPIESYGEPLGPGLARLALTSDRGAVTIDDLRSVPELKDEPDAAPFVAFIGTPIDVSGARYGCLCFADRRRRRTPFDDVDRDLVQLMGALISSAIERGRSRARLQTLAYSDTVTALPNRAWLVDHLRALLEEARRTETSVGVLFLDLDRFKDINDTLGHDTGDRLLRIVGERLERAIRTDDVVARMGGDEFVVLAGGSPDMQALGGLAERIVATVEEPIQVDSSELFVTTSIGIASFPADGGDAETLVKHADVAMYRAKDRGRNTYQFFTPALNATLHTRLSQEKSLRKALDNGEFVVYYQPQHDLISGNLTAVEALVRWNHPRSGLVLPGQFIPNAELSGLIVALGDFILESACTDISALRKTIAPNLRLAVNLSARQFHQQRLAAKVRGYVERTGLDPTALELEITESVAMNDAALTVSIMRDIGAEGMSLSVDDFGTGYSSLGYLRRFPLDSIKIDRSFVTDLAQEPDDATIVRTVIAMAHSLDLEVIAEGVETAEQLAFLRTERCDRVQGFYFSQAVPLETLESYIIRGTEATAAG
jgi:diguanylate cyclase (GGDEF)-like protein/PAS domain S-box-containing protein